MLDWQLGHYLAPLPGQRGVSAYSLEKPRVIRATDAPGLPYGVAGPCQGGAHAAYRAGYGAAARGPLVLVGRGVAVSGNWSRRLDTMMAPRQLCEPRRRNPKPGVRAR